MAEESNQKTQAKKAAPSEASLDRDALIRDARKLTGHRPADVAGALHGNNKKSFTPSEAKTLTDKWLKKPVSV